MADMHDPDYQEYQQYLQYLNHTGQGSTQPASPQGPRAAGGYTDPYSQYLDRHENDSVGQKLKAIILGDKDNPQIDGDVPLAAPAAALPKVAGFAEKVASSPYGRVGLSAAQGGAEGLLRTPGDGETRLGNAWNGAKMGALMSTGAEGMAQAANATKAALTYGGGKLVGATYPQAKNYVANPGLANEMYDLNKNDPMELSSQIKQHIGGGLDEAFDKVSQPALDRVGKAVAGKQIAVRPDDFSGTEAGKEVNRAWNVQGNRVQMDVPTYEPHTVQASPVTTAYEAGDPIKMTPVRSQLTPGKEIKATPIDYTQNIGKPEVQRAYTPQDPYNDSLDVPVSQISPGFRKAGPAQAVATEVTPEIVKAGPVQEIGREINPVIKKTGSPQTLEDLLIPRGTQSVSTPAPAPDRMTLTGPQALQAKRVSQKAAFQNQANALNPLAYNAADDAEAQAASRMRKAIENVAPSTTADNDTLEQAARYSAHAKSALKNNPASILVDSDSTGSLPTRSMRQFLDEKGGTQLGSLSDSLSAGKAVNGENAHAGILDRLLARPAGKALLGGASTLSPEAIRALPAPILDKLMREQSK